MRISYYRCFCTNEKFSGNPAAIITGFNGSQDQKQKLATELNLPVSVFINNETSSQPLIEFFYPEREMALCLHGTIAAGFHLLNQHHQNQLIVTTRDGTILKITGNRNTMQVSVAEKPCPQLSISKDEVLAMLRITTSDIDNDLPLKITSVGSPKLLVPLITLSSLQSLTPDFDLIKAWSMKTGVNGIYAYTKETLQKHAHIHARNFNPKGGHYEDAATGTAAGALALALQKDLVIEQGYSLQMPSQLIVTYQNPANILVGGIVEAQFP